jgi:hypothetical protein
MQSLEVSGAVRPIYGSLGVKRLSIGKKGKVKVHPCTQALRPCRGRTAHRGSRFIALHFLEHRCRRAWGVSVMLRSEKILYPLYKRLYGPQGRSGQVRKISPPTGIRSPDRPARSKSLYRLRYPAHIKHRTTVNFLYLYVSIDGMKYGEITGCLCFEEATVTTDDWTSWWL